MRSWIILLAAIQSALLVRALSNKPSLFQAASVSTTFRQPPLPNIPNYRQICSSFCTKYFPGDTTCASPTGYCGKCGPLKKSQSFYKYHIVPQICPSSPAPNSPAVCCTAEAATCCDNNCVDILSDNDYCGSCTNACNPGDVCIKGRCRAAPSGYVDNPDNCGSGLTKCSGVCYNLKESNSNCGSCGNSCGLDANGVQTSCIKGVCTSVTPVCQPGKKFCGWSVGCLDVLSSSTNCGYCGAACEHGTCRQGRCYCNAGYATCASNSLCGTQIGTDLNCAGCGDQCHSTMVCSGKKCKCKPGLRDCDGDPSNGCEVNILTDTTNCGACGATCDGNCVLGVCDPNGCGNGYARCQNQKTCKTNTLIDSSNCGHCGTACGPNEWCDDGVCLRTCSPPQTSCPALSGGISYCTNLNQDVNNCGSCNHVCPTGTNGEPATCTLGVCSVTCATGTACGNSCVDLSTSNSNCGQCGKSCPGKQSCVSGQCVCPGGALFDACDNVCGCQAGTGCVRNQERCYSCPECAYAPTPCVCTPPN